MAKGISLHIGVNRVDPERHLGLWPVESLQVEREVKARPPPQTSAPKPNVHIDKSDSQVPPCEDYLFHDPEYPIEA